MMTFALALASTALGTQDHQNRGLLGVVTAPDKDGVRVLQAVPQAPADRAGLQADDLLLKIGRTATIHPADVDRALRAARPGQSIDVVYRRGRKTSTVTIKLIDRLADRGRFVRGRRPGSTNFQAPEWMAYAWANLKKEQKAPTRATTRGKVVVIHAFQSW